MKKIILAAFLTASHAAFALTAKEYIQKPKLVVLIVIDQFRADYLTGLMQNPKADGGLKLLAKEGAWFPFAEHGSYQDITCPGHATISTGAFPAAHGIQMNEWYDRKSDKFIYCAQDDDYGVSPRRLKTNTFGDELRMANPESKVISISLKDRAAIMLGGYNPNIVLWVNPASQWATSTYYNKGILPDWVLARNELLKKHKSELEDRTVESAKLATEEILNTAIQAVKSEKLGSREQTDVLLISLSNHDLIGHSFGPNSKEIWQLTDIEDKLVGQFLNNLKSVHGNLSDTLIVLTADHGVAPAIQVANQNKIEARRIDFDEIKMQLNEYLNKKFSRVDSTNWFKEVRNRNFFFSMDTIKKSGRTYQQVEDEARIFLATVDGVDSTFTQADYVAKRFPEGLTGKQLRQSYIPSESGDILVLVKPFYYDKDQTMANHSTGWSYDRMVPIVMMGAHIAAGVYAGGEVVDVAPTISFLLGTLPPAHVEGRVLKEIFK